MMDKRRQRDMDDEERVGDSLGKMGIERERKTNK
jgi:hypothetical protein